MTNGTKGSSTSGKGHLGFFKLQGNTEPHAAWDVGYSGARQRWCGISLMLNIVHFTLLPRLLPFMVVSSHRVFSLSFGRSRSHSLVAAAIPLLRIIDFQQVMSPG